MQCQNCGGKLVIRSAKYLGKTVACPRCNKAVRVPLSFDEATPEKLQADSQDLTSVDIEALQRTAPPASIPAGEQTTSSFDDDDFDGVEAALAAASTFTPEPEPSDLFGDLTDDSGSEPEHAQVDDSFPQGEPLGRSVPPVSHDRKLYMWGAVAVGICLLSMTLLYIFLLTMKKTPQVAQVEQKPAQPAIAEENAAKEQPPAANAQEKPPVTAEPVTPPVTEIANDANPVNDVIGPAEPVVPRDQGAKILFQPKADDPANIAAQEPAAPEPSAELPEGLRDLAKLFDPGSLQTMQEAKVLKPDEVDGGAGYAEQSEIAVLYHPDPSPLPNWEDIRGTNVLAIEFTDKPLLEVLTTLESIFGAPCAWDVGSLALQPIDFEKRVTKKYENTNLESIYTDLLADYGLVLNPQPEGLPRIEASKELAAEVQLDIAIADLDGDVTGDAWLSFFQGLFPDAKDQLSLQNDRIVFGEGMTLKQRRQIANLAWQIQHAKRPNATGGKQLTALQSQELATTYDALRKPGEIAYARRSPATMALTQAAQEMDLPLMIDWNECWNYGLTPFENTSLLTKNRNFSQVSRFVLDEYALTIIIDPLGRLVLTTPPAQREMIQYRVVSMTDPVTVATLKQSLLPLWPKGADGKSTLLVQALPSKDPKPSLAVIRICAPSLANLIDTGVLSALNLQVPD